MSVEALIEFSPANRLDCFSNTTLSFRAYYKQIHGSGGCDGSRLLGDGWLTSFGFGPQTIFVFGRPDAELSLGAQLHPPLDPITLPPNRWVEITGHFDDPAAEQCKTLAPDGSSAISEPTYLQECREQFVAVTVRPD